ncbi:MAG: hypothetical protein AVDCRST_MAG13-3065, partial [uncultured Solirubrobacteraceae bacterium]
RDAPRHPPSRRPPRRGSSAASACCCSPGSRPRCGWRAAGTP